MTDSAPKPIPKWVDQLEAKIILYVADLWMVNGYHVCLESGPIARIIAQHAPLAEAVNGYGLTWHTCHDGKIMPYHSVHCSRHPGIMEDTNFNPLERLKELAKAEQEIRWGERRELLKQACDVLTRHNGAMMMRCGCIECRHAESFAAQLANCIIDADRARFARENGGGS